MIKSNKKTLKTFVFSLGLAALMLTPLKMNAQYDEEKYGLQPWFGTSLMGKENSSNRDGESTGDISNWGIGETVPLGSGIVILLGAGLGYMALKKKEDEQ